jgi:hypothetical protein
VIEICLGLVLVGRIRRVIICDLIMITAWPIGLPHLVGPGSVHSGGVGPALLNDRPHHVLGGMGRHA